MVYLIIAGLPCLALILSLFSRFCCGPFWLGANNDPAYLYFMNSLYLADHKIPTFTQHPGTPLQILGAVIIKILSFPAQGGAMVEEAIKRPEYYLSAIYAALITFYIITLILLGWYAYRQTKNSLFVLMVQSPVFLYLTMYKHPSSLLPVLANVCAESLLIGFLNIYSIFLLRAFFNKETQSLLLTAIGWGVVCGLMMATKVICLPLLLMPVIFLCSFKARIAFVLAAAAGFITATLPVWSQYPAIFSWLALLMTHQENVGNGAVGFIDWPVYFSALMIIFKWQWLLMTSAVFAAGFVLTRCLFGFFDGAKSCRYAAWVAGTIILQYLMVGKESQNHYMIPAMGLFGVLWAFVYWGARRKFWLWRGAVSIFAAASIFLSIVYMRNFYASSRDMIEFSKEIYSRFDQCVICGYYRSSSQPFALEFGDDNAGRRAYGDVIQKLYPQHYFMAVLPKRFDDSKRLVYAEDILEQSPCVLLYGSVSEFKEYTGPLLRLQFLEQRGQEGLFRVLQAHDKQAMRLYDLAQLAMLQGQGQIAYMLGLRAEALGLPAAHDLVVEMNGIISRGVRK